MTPSDGAAAAFPGGRRAALERLAALKPGTYARSRNFLDGAVSRLSPYLRHGVLDLAEVRDAAVGRSGAAASSKFVFELAWRDYWRRVYAELGDRVWEDLEPYATGHAASSYAAELPEDIVRGETGDVCIDGFVRDLVDGGYVHNHARMWFASYVVHHRRVRWQAGAAFYLEHLLDGDPASNNLSWQWVAGTFSREPYFFNRGNLERYTTGRYCAVCPKAGNGCPFEATYPELERRLFARDAARPRPSFRLSAPPDPEGGPPEAPPAGGAIVWHHVEALSPSTAARAAAPGAPALVTLDPAGMASREAWAPQRTAFVRACAEACEATVAEGAAVAEVRAFAERHGARRVLVDASADPLIRAQIRELGTSLDVTVIPARPFARLPKGGDLGRFSRYWRTAKRTAFGVEDEAKALSLWNDAN